MIALKAQCVDLVKSQIDTSTLMNEVAQGAFLIGLFLVTIQTAIELCKLAFADPPKTTPPARTAIANFSSLVTALPKLIDALSKASASVVLIGLAFMLVVFSNFEPSDTCKAAMGLKEKV